VQFAIYVRWLALEAATDGVARGRVQEAEVAMKLGSSGGLLGLGLALALALAGRGCDSGRSSRDQDSGTGADLGQGEVDLGPDRSCTSRRDCPAGRTCDLDGQPPRCVEPPETCVGNEDCPPGMFCEIDVCKEGCNNASDCPVDWGCREISAGVRRCQQSCEKKDDCPAGFLCEAKVCVAEVVLCAECERDADCGGLKDLCLEGPQGKFCAKDCSLKNDCPAGYRCETVQAEARQCVPALGECDTICPLNPCPEGKVCNRHSGRCHEALAPCDPCQGNDECGEGARCVTFGQARFCLLPCPDGDADCGKGYRCDTSGAQPYCLPITGTCDRCYGKVCSPLAPYCNPEDGSCLECLSSRHCSDVESCSSSNMCIANGPACSEVVGEPVCPETQSLCYEQRCVECINSPDCKDSDLVCYHFRCLGEDFCQRISCPAGTVCDRESRRCIETGTCASDRDCPGRRCDDVRGVCYDADGSCVSSGECPPRLECDPAYQVCVGCTEDTECRPLQRCWPLGDARNRRFCNQL